MSAAWRRVKLGDVAEAQVGFAFKSDRFTDTADDIPLVKGENVSQGRVLWDISKRWPAEEWPEFAKYHLHAGDVVVAMDRPWVPAGLKWAPIRHGDGPALLVQRVARLRSANGSLEQSYLPVLIGSPAFDDYLRPITTGVNVPHVSARQILDFEFHLPPVRAQRRISAILAAYDDLIENNLRRIQILEEIARATYCEWFAYFRFPGHVGVGRLESPLGSIPEGWEMRPVGELVTVLGGGTPSRNEPSYWDGGEIQWYAPRDLTAAGTMFMDRSAECITQAGLNRSSAKLFPAFSVMMTSRATIGAIAINTREAATNQGFIICVPTDRVPLIFLYHWLQEHVPLFERLATGATFKEISRGTFKTIDLVLPPIAIVGCYEQTVRPIADLVLVLQRSVKNLRATRDLLLPRLMSGQLTFPEAEEAIAPSL